MKKKYSKPTVAVESLALNQPIALNCLADFDDVRSLIDIGYFGDESTCDLTYDEVEFGNDTVCYHSNVHTAFLS